MDIFVEQLVKKKKGTKELLMILGSVIGSFILIFTLLLSLTIPGLGMVIFAVCVVLIYILYFMVVSVNMEYEYCFTNGVLDVDKIINAQRRKSMVEINIRKMELMGDRNAAEFGKYMANTGVKKIYACTHKDAENLCFLVFIDDSGKMKMLLFNPNEEIKDGIRRYNPQKVVFS